MLEDKVAMITGASSGIGRSTALLFGQNKAQIALVGRDTHALELVAAEISAETLVLKADLSIERNCKELINKTIDAFGRLDILVNSAGIIGTGTVESTLRDEWSKMMAINVDAVFDLIRYAIPHLKKTAGNIINLSSIAGLRSFPNVFAYCVSKAAVDQLTRCAALELAPYGVRVNAVNPGVVVTNLHRRGGFDEKKYSEFLDHSKSTHPLGRVGQPREIAEAILFLASEKSGWITGETLSIDGGRHLTCAR